jgi:hypothetical protein
MPCTEAGIEQLNKLSCIGIISFKVPQKIGPDFISHNIQLIWGCLYFDAEFMFLGIQECTNKCAVLQYRVFTVKAIEFQSVSTLSSGSSLWSVNQYLYKT